MIDLVTVAFNHPGTIREQHRLLHKYLREDFVLTVLDNSSTRAGTQAISNLCTWLGVGYQRLTVDSHRHDLALQWGCLFLRERGAPYIGFLDHDVYPIRETRLIPLIEEGGGLWGIPQNYNGRDYLWPGLCFFSTEWLGNDDLVLLSLDGDTGSGMCVLLEKRGFSPQHFNGPLGTIVPLIEERDRAVQAYACEIFGDWLHAFNMSRWLEGQWHLRRRFVHYRKLQAKKETALFEMLAAL